MNAPERLADWTDANQRLLVAEFARLAALLGGTEAAPGDDRASLRAQLPVPAAIDRLAQLFGLSGFERDLLLLAAGVEMDARLAQLCATAQGAPHKPWPSFSLALATLPDAHWSALAPSAPLRHWRLLEVDEQASLASARLRIDERVLHYLAGVHAPDHRLAPLLQPLPRGDAPLALAQQRAATELVQALTASNGRMPPVLLDGDDEAGQLDVAAAVAARLGVRVYRMHAADLPASALEQAALAVLWMREAALQGAALLLHCEEAEHQGAVARLLARLDGLVIVCGQLPLLPGTPVLRASIDRPDAPERARLWQAALGPHAPGLSGTIDQLASQYRLGPRRIAEAAALASGGDAAADASALHAAARGPGHGMPGLAQRIDARARWRDLVLPDAQQDALRQIAAQVRHQLTVLHRWGFAAQGSRGLGLATLFWGESGTGKTLAAEVLANELHLALYRIDLSAVVSKYIGETEKNLRRVFDAAEQAGAILLFDEADALFGKRSEVKDSHDRYANIEVSYLLQRMEAYGGLAILTSNHKAALDPAFQRRLRFVVQFPFPDQAQREGIWRAVFPADAPLAADIDYARLARLGVAGGSIRNIALGAAFLAAEAGQPIGMAALLRAAQLEAAKRDKPYSDAETRGWA